VTAGRGMPILSGAQVRDLRVRLSVRRPVVLLAHTQFSLSAQLPGRPTGLLGSTPDEVNHRVALGKVDFSLFVTGQDDHM
jgi:hypothetical protein